MRGDKETERLGGGETGCKEETLSVAPLLCLLLPLEADRDIIVGELVKVAYDTQADALYIQLREGKFVRDREVGEGVIHDRRG